MDSSSMEEDENMMLQLNGQSNEDYMETGEEEVNDMVPILQRLSINDDTYSGSRSNISVDTITNSANDFERDAIADSKNKALPVFPSDASGNLLVRENIKDAVDIKKSPSGSVELPQNAFFKVAMNVSRPQNVIQKTSIDEKTSLHPVDKKVEQLLDETTEIEESRADKLPIDVSSKQSKYHSNEADFNSTENETEFPVLITEPEESGVDKLPIDASSKQSKYHKNEADFNSTENETEFPVLITEPEEIGVDKLPIDVSSKQSKYHSNEADFNSTENETEFPVLITEPEKMEYKDSENGEISKTSNIILSENPSHDRISNTMEQYADNMSNTSNSNLPENRSHGGIADIFEQFAGEMACDIVDIFSLKQAYSADVSSDDQSNTSSDVFINSPTKSPDGGAVAVASVKNKPSKKISIFVPPVAGMSEIRRQRFDILQPKITKFDARKATSSSDEDTKKPRTARKVSPINSNRKCRKTVKASPISRKTNPSDIGMGEGKRSSLYKRKKSRSDSTNETPGKFRKRCSSEHDAETGEKTRSAIRSRSLSSGSKNRHHASANTQPTKVSTTPQSRKRASSDCPNASRFKHRKSSSSSNDGDKKIRQLP